MSENPLTKTSSNENAPLSEESAVGNRRSVPSNGPNLAALLARLPVLDRANQGLKDLDPEIFAKEHLTKLLLMQNYLTTIPKEISKLKNLTHVDLSYNRLRVLPGEICELAQLEELQLGGNSVSVFPAGMKAMTSLKKLSLTANKLKMFPTQICNLPSLVTLDVSRNQFTFLPLEIRYLTSLTELNCTENHLKSMTAHVGHLVYLTNLDASKNEMTSLPNELGDCVALTQLNLSQNMIEKIPVTLVNLMSLTKLDLSQNHIVEIPVDICQERFDENGALVAGLISLTNLNMAGNYISELPSEFFDLTALQELNLTHNKLAELSARIENLKNLYRLHLGGNVLTTLPSVIGSLQYLETVNLFDNRIISLPPEITYFGGLIRLFLGYNSLTSIPLTDTPEYLEWENLEELHLSGNKLGKLPNAIGNLWALKNLALADTGLTSLPPTISFLTGLTCLDVSINKLTSLPNEFACLTNLQRLNLSRNEITELKDSLFDDMMSTLEEVNLIGNKLTSYPPNIIKLIEREANVYIDLNPVDKIPNLKRDSIVLSKRFKVGLSEMIGRRTAMEDAVVIKGGFMGKDDVDLFCVFDGHGGTVAANFAAENIPLILEKYLKKGDIEPILAIKQAILDTNEAFRGYLKGKDNNLSHSGCTALVVLIMGTRVYIGNLGDTRCVLVSTGQGIRVTEDHKPINDEDRINALGGWLTGESTKRVNGMLAVARSIGDFYLEPFVNSEPFLEEFDLKSEHDYLILACDGVWDEVHDELAADVCRAEVDPFRCALALRDHGYCLNSDDNLSVIVVGFK